MSSGKALAELRRIDPYEFEQLVADVWEQRGWDTTVTTGSADRGIDIIARKESPIKQKHLIQAKRFAEGNKIGSPDIQQYSSLRRQEGDVDSVIIVTTSSFTPQAERTATDLNVKMVDGEELLDMMNELEMSVGDISVENVRGKSERELNQKQPFDGDINDMEATPTKSHDYVSNCPACSEINSLWFTRYKQDGLEILKCEACGDMLSKTKTSDGLFQGSSMKWKLYSNHSELDGEAKTAKEWREY